MKKFLLSLVAVVAIAGASQAQVAVKTDLAKWAVGMSNLQVEWGFANNWSATIDANYGAFGYKNLELDGWAAGAELRYYTCRVFKGHHFGLSGYYGQLDRLIDNKSWLDFGNDISSDVLWRRDVHGYRIGLAYGYYFNISKHFGLDCSVGYTYNSCNFVNQVRGGDMEHMDPDFWKEEWGTDYTEYMAYHKGDKDYKKTKNFFYPSLSVALSYNF